MPTGGVLVVGLVPSEDQRAPVHSVSFSSSLSLCLSSHHVGMQQDGATYSQGGGSHQGQNPPGP